MYRLIFEEDGTNRIYPIVQDEISLGRAPESDVVLTNFTISRLHAKIVKDSKGCRIVDQASRNGTQVNGRPVSDAPLRDGDEIYLGKFPIRFSEISDEKIVVDEKSRELAPGTIIRPLSELLSSLAPDKKPPSERKNAPSSKPDAKTTEAHAEDRSAQILRILGRVAEALITTQPVEEVLRTVMDLVFSYLPAHRGFLMLHEPETDQLVPKIVKYRRAVKEAGAISISRTIADRVFKDQVAILTSDAKLDDRFDGGQSILLHNIRSAMYAPLWNKGRVIGIISVDSPVQAGAFTQADLDLFSALANFSAVAIEQARLNVKIQEEQARRARLERYFSPNVVNRITTAKDSTTGHLIDVQEREVTVLFSDLVGFTAMSGKMKPQEVAMLLNEYFTEMLEIVFAYDGTLDKYIGDCVMVVFGAPFEQPDHADRAVKAAIEMRQRLNEFNRRRSDGPRLKAHTGINSGRVVAGDIGSHKRKEYTVIGDTVNLAARLECDVAKADQIIIGPSTHALLKGQYEINSLGSVAVRSIEKPLELYEVLGEKGKPEPTPAA
ncbi:MAG: FHA domain-containing protein [Nitrospirae bacterium]|nr:FHA domain-containing protein [Nitrospirota bacterium]